FPSERSGPRVLGRRDADRGGEVADQVGLVGVSEVVGQVRPVDRDPLIGPGPPPRADEPDAAPTWGSPPRTRRRAVEACGPRRAAPRPPGRHGTGPGRS